MLSSRPELRDLLRDFSTSLEMTIRIDVFVRNRCFDFANNCGLMNLNEVVRRIVRRKGVGNMPQLVERVLRHVGCSCDLELFASTKIDWSGQMGESTAFYVCAECGSLFTQLREYKRDSPDPKCKPEKLYEGTGELIGEGELTLYDGKLLKDELLEKVPKCFHVCT